jgi:hypothetical protein
MQCNSIEKCFRPGFFFRADCVVDPDLLGPFDSRSESELEASETEQQLQHPVSDIHVNTTKRGRANVTYERKSFFENSKASTSHVKAEKHVKGAKKVASFFCLPSKIRQALVMERPKANVNILGHAFKPEQSPSLICNDQPKSEKFRPLPSLPTVENLLS